MVTKAGLLLFAIVYLQGALVRAAPDWLPPEIYDMIAEDKSRCMSEHGTKQEEIDEVATGTIKNAPSITCYMYCMLEAFSLVDDEAQLETEMMVGLLPEQLQDKANSVLTKCTPTTGSDNCDKIYNLATCVQSSAPDVWFMV